MFSQARYYFWGASFGPWASYCLPLNRVLNGPEKYSPTLVRVSESRTRPGSARDNYLNGEPENRKRPISFSFFSSLPPLCTEWERLASSVCVNNVAY